MKLADAMGVQHQRVSEPDKLVDALSWLINTDGPALLGVIAGKKVPVLPMVPGGSALHEFLVFDGGEICNAPKENTVVNQDMLTQSTEKDKQRRELMKERTKGVHS
ncbi:acetolactate synthase [Trichoderma cornu-damae]|uniref:Acetolactate synthase n=1 Tax=Trichoderma cornu-damae TaxID=654480 RepID=A0A9P8QUR5_9HYPO|nr:acetolactate synthase [Trichoderma cornu-damae]